MQTGGSSSKVLFVPGVKREKNSGMEMVLTGESKDGQGIPLCSIKNQSSVYWGKRQRTFKQSWQKDFPWVKYEKNQGKMFCCVCLQFPEMASKKSAFFTGNDCFKRENLVSHDLSKKHRMCMAASASTVLLISEDRNNGK